MGNQSDKSFKTTLSIILLISLNQILLCFAINIIHLSYTCRYASEGESFTLADPNEVWIVELIGKADLGWGAVWVAKKVPDGHIHSHANQARITELIEDERNKTMLWSDDVIQFAIDNKVFI